MCEQVGGAEGEAPVEVEEEAICYSAVEVEEMVLVSVVGLGVELGAYIVAGYLVEWSESVAVMKC
jgi:hypothetical protein